MSISSCPQCAKQISLPTGVANSAKVRCPLCRAQYTLADALVNMPPLLEVIEDVAPSAPGGGFDLPPEHGAEGELRPTSHDEPSLPVEMATAPEAHDEDGPVADLSHSVDAEEELAFEAPEIEHDDLSMQDQDTEIEELNITIADPVMRVAPMDIEQLELAGPDEESVLEFERNKPAPDEPARDASAGEDIEIDFDHVPSADKPAVGSEVAFNVAAPEATKQPDDEIALDFGEPAAVPPQADGSATGLDFGEALPAEAHADQEEIELDFGNATPAAEDAKNEDMPLDFGEPIEAEPTPVTAADSPPPQADKGQKKKKKQREKAPAKERRQGSLVRTLVSLLLCSVVALPLALYGVLWISDDYDLFGVGRYLPASMLPANFGKSKYSKPIAAAPTSQPSQLAPQQTGPAGVEPAPAAADPAAQTTPEAAKTEGGAEPLPTPGAAPPVVDAAASKPDDAPPEPPVADEPATGSDRPGPAQDTAKSAVAAGNKPDDSADKPGEVVDKNEPASAGKPAGDDKSASASPSPLDASDNAKQEVRPSESDTAEPAEAVGPRDAVQVTLTDLATAMHAAGTANQKFLALQESTDEGEIKKARAQFYMSLYRLAEALTFAKDDPANPQLDGQRKILQQVLMQVAGDENRVEALGLNAGRWLSYPKRTVSGVVLAGTVQSIEQLGKLYHIKMELASEKPVIVTAVTSHSPKLKPNDRALVLGSIVEKPAQQIAGYEGDEAAVVWIGMAVPIPAAQ